MEGAGLLSGKGKGKKRGRGVAWALMKGGCELGQAQKWSSGTAGDVFELTSRRASSHSHYIRNKRKEHLQGGRLAAPLHTHSASIVEHGPIRPYLAATTHTPVSLTLIPPTLSIPTSQTSMYLIYSHPAHGHCLSFLLHYQCKSSKSSAEMFV